MRVYVSHSIRGHAGLIATTEEMQLNCDLAKKFGGWLGENFPMCEFYVPADHDLFVQKAYFKNYLTEKQILDVDCEIVNECDALIIYTPDGYVSRGMNVEINFADNKAIPIFPVNRPDNLTRGDLAEFFYNIKINRE